MEVFKLNGLDFILILFLVISAFRGYKRGLIAQITSLIGFFLAVWVAYAFSLDLAMILQGQFPLFDTSSSVWMKILPIEMVELMIYRSISFLILFTGVKLAIWGITKLFQPVFQFPVVASVNRYGGLLFGTLTVVLLAFVLLNIVNYFPFGEKLGMVEQSFLAQGILKVSPAIREMLTSW
ncbi:CvpA family protein [Risungbinella massiliensis]|uniref:CvpA family protein n=1 Tax=Risungbinella massiliensis TaxID=1329796 RepID=UPI0005CB84D7|nr:CvpA family protein [Risungbinella massiliensis]